MCKLSKKESKAEKLITVLVKQSTTKGMCWNVQEFKLFMVMCLRGQYNRHISTSSYTEVSVCTALSYCLI